MRHAARRCHTLRRGACCTWRSGTCCEVSRGRCKTRRCCRARRRRSDARCWRSHTRWGGDMRRGCGDVRSRHCGMRRAAARSPPLRPGFVAKSGCDQHKHYCCERMEMTRHGKDSARHRLRNAGVASLFPRPNGTASFSGRSSGSFVAGIQALTLSSAVNSDSKKWNWRMRSTACQPLGIEVVCGRT
jgi:hypothetical protein